MLKTTDAALLMGNIQSCSLTLWNSLSPSSTLPQEGKMRATDVHKKAWCSSNLWYLNPVCHLAHAHGSREKALCTSPSQFPRERALIPQTTSAQAPFPAPQCCTWVTPSQSPPRAPSYFLLTPFEPQANLQSSQFIPLSHPSESSVLGLSIISFIE